MSAPTMAPPQVAGQPLMPYGILGDLARAVGPVAGGAVGGWLGNEQLGRQLGDYAGQLAQRYSPYGAGPVMAEPQQPHPAQVLQALSMLPPVAQQQVLATAQQVQAQAGGQLAPYGLIGNIIGRIAPHIGQHFGGSTGQQIGNVAGQLASRFLPFEAGPQLAGPQLYGPQLYGVDPQLQGQLDPYGFFGNLIGRIAPHVGQAFGGSTGQQIGNVAGQLASRFLPFEAGPQLAGPQLYGVDPQLQGQLDPYGFFGNLIGRIAPHVGQAFGGSTGQQIGNVAGQLVNRFLPFEAGPQLAGPQLYAAQPAPVAMPTQGQLDPYGIFGGALGNFLGGLGGRAVGGAFGHSGLGKTIGSGIGTALGAILPFASGPVGYPQPQPQPYPPYGQSYLQPQYSY